MMKRMFVLLIFLVFYLIFYIGKRNLDNLVEKERTKLRTNCRDLSGLFYTKDQISGVPDPVRRYFETVLKDAQPYISSVYLEYDGQIKKGADGEWVNIEGQQYFTADSPGFLLKGKTALFTVKDSYISCRGQKNRYLLNLLRVKHIEGAECDQEELERWLGASVWFPTNLLPGSRLQWSPIDDKSAELNFVHNGMKGSFKVSFNPEGEITRMETLPNTGEDGCKPWSSRLSCYEKVNGMKIPMKVEYSCARIRVRKIQHN